MPVSTISHHRSGYSRPIVHVQWVSNGTLFPSDPFPLPENHSLFREYDRKIQVAFEKMQMFNIYNSKNLALKGLGYFAALLVASVLLYVGSRLAAGRLGVFLKLSGGIVATASSFFALFYLLDMKNKATQYHCDSISEFIESCSQLKKQEFIEELRKEIVDIFSSEKASKYLDHIAVDVVDAQQAINSCQCSKKVFFKDDHRAEVALYGRIGVFINYMPNLAVSDNVVNKEIIVNRLIELQNQLSMCA